MAAYYVRSGAGGAGTGADWANAFTTLAAALSGRAATDVIYVADDHHEVSSGAVSLGLPTSGDGFRIICAGDHVTEPPVTTATTAIVEVGVGSWGLAIYGRGYIYGVQFLGSTAGSSAAVVGLAGNATIISNLTFEDCVVKVRSSASTARLNLLNSTNSSAIAARVRLLNTELGFNHASQTATVGQGTLEFTGVAFDSSTTLPSTLFTPNNGGSCFALMEGCDFSDADFSYIIDGDNNATQEWTLRNCKLGSAPLISGTIASPGTMQVSAHNCDSSGTNYRLWLERYAGTVLSETTIVRSGGASNGTTDLSWKMTSNGSAVLGAAELWSPYIAVWNTTSGSSVTVTVDVVTDGVTLTDAECWLEAQYLGSSSFPLSTFISDRLADIMASPANQASSSATWTTTGLASPVKQQLSVTFTPQMEGPLLCRVVLARASTTVYVDPVAQVS